MLPGRRGKTAVERVHDTTRPPAMRVVAPAMKFSGRLRRLAFGTR